MGTSHDARLMPAKYVRPYSRGEALAISVPAGETRVLKHFQERMPYGLLVPDVPSLRDREVISS
jgi:hypothetical protein